MSDHSYIKAYHKWQREAEIAYQEFKAMAPLACRVPGMSTDIRLAWRMECGRTLKEAVAREYIYRWNLALAGGEWAAMQYAPHSLGM